MNALIETSSGNVLVTGDIDFSTSSMYDSGIHTIKNDVPDTLIPYNPRHDDKFHRWNGTDWEEGAVTADDKDHAKAIADVVIRGKDGKDYRIEIDAGVISAVEIV